MLTRSGRLFIVAMFALVTGYASIISTIYADDTTTSATGYVEGDESDTEETTSDLEIEATGTEVGTLAVTANNTLLGIDSGRDLITGATHNTFIGFKSGLRAKRKDRNTFVGSLSGRNNTKGSGNVFLGYKAGINEKGSNKLYIANSDGAPIIYGDFSTSNIGIGTTAPSNHLTIKQTGDTGGASTPLKIEASTETQVFI